MGSNHSKAQCATGESQEQVILPPLPPLTAGEGEAGTGIGILDHIPY